MWSQSPTDLLNPKNRCQQTAGKKASSCWYGIASFIIEQFAAFKREVVVVFQYTMVM